MGKLLHSGSQNFYIAEDLVQKLRLRRRRANMEFSGVAIVSMGMLSSVVDQMLNLENDVEFRTKAPIVKHLTNSASSLSKKN